MKTFCIATIILSLAAVCHAETTETMALSPSFKRFDAPVTGRKVVQLTDGKGWNYPLYFFIPTITRDNKYLIHHKAEDGQVQLYRLNLATGESRQLDPTPIAPTRSDAPGASIQAGGVLDHRSVLNVARNLVVYFNGNEVRAVDVETLEDRRLFDIPDDRDAYGQNCCTPDGRWLVYIHVPLGSTWGKPCKGAAVCCVQLRHEGAEGTLPRR